MSERVTFRNVITDARTEVEIEAGRTTHDLAIAAGIVAPNASFTVRDLDGNPVDNHLASKYPRTILMIGSARSFHQVSGDYVQNVITNISKTDPEDIQKVGASQLALSTSYYENVLLQARRSFLAAIISATAGFLFFVAAVSIFLVRNDLRAGTVSAISGGIVEVISGLNFWLYGRTASQLNSFHVRLEQTQKYLLANSLSTKLSGDSRDAALTDLIKSIAGHRTTSDTSQ